MINIEKRSKTLSGAKPIKNIRKNLQDSLEFSRCLSPVQKEVLSSQEIRWRGALAHLITEKNSVYKVFWVGNNLGLGGVGILVSRKWIDMNLR